MKDKLFGSKRRIAVVVVTTVVVLSAAVAGYAYFTASGSGTGSASVATPSSIVITQVGAGYSSLVPNDAYIQDQCFACASITAFGNDIKLAKPGLQRLGNVVVAFRNWGPAFGPGSGTPVTITMTLDDGHSATATPNFTGALPSGRPTVTDVTFNFGGVFVNQEILYKITFDARGAASGLNVALSSSAVDLSKGSDSVPGAVWLTTTSGAGIAGDFPACTTPGTGFAQVNTACGSSAPGNPGAYGNGVGLTSADADVPAVEFNVLGGGISALSPGVLDQPVEFAITNPGPSTVHVSTIGTSISSVSGAGTTSGIEACTATSPFFHIDGSPATVNLTVPAGTTLVAPPSGTRISMLDDGNNQDNCEGATINLAFSSN